MDDAGPIPDDFREARELLALQGFEVQGLLGRGGAGVVLATEHAPLGKVAVKLAWPWPAGMADHEPDVSRDRIRRSGYDAAEGRMRYTCPSDQAYCNRLLEGEFRRLAGRSDGGLVQVHRTLLAGTHVAYVMERVAGGALDLGARSHLRALGLVVQRLHAAGWAHGDLKPSNVRADDDDRVRLIDPVAAGAEVTTPGWSHLNILLSTPLVSSADPRDRRNVLVHRDLVALALMVVQHFTQQRPWGYREVTDMVDRTIPNAERGTLLVEARERLEQQLGGLPASLRPFVSLALEPGIWPDEGPTFAAYLQARPFERRCEALRSLDAPGLVAEACG